MQTNPYNDKASKPWTHRLHWKQAALGGFLFFFAKGMIWLGLAAWVVLEQVEF